MSDNILRRILERSQIGGCGVVLIDDTDEHTGPFAAVQALVESTIDVSECTTGIEDAADITIPQGVTIFGHFTSIELDADGKVLAYRACN